MDVTSYFIMNDFEMSHTLQDMNHTTLLLICVKSSYKVVNLEYTVVTVPFLVPPTVKTTHVTYRTENVLHVNQDGVKCFVTQNVGKDGTVSTVVNNA